MSESSKRLTREEYIEEILIFLYKSNAPMQNIKEIAEGIGVTQQTVTKYLYFMLPSYLHERIVDPSKFYFLTNEGRRKAEEILEKREKEESRSNVKNKEQIQINNQKKLNNDE